MTFPALLKAAPLPELKRGQSVEDMRFFGSKLQCLDVANSHSDRKVRLTFQDCDSSHGSIHCFTPELEDFVPSLECTGQRRFIRGALFGCRAIPSHHPPTAMDGQDIVLSSAMFSCTENLPVSYQRHCSWSRADAGVVKDILMFSIYS